MPDEGTRGNGEVTKYRVDDLERRVERLETWRVVVDEDRANLKAEMRALRADMARVVELGERGQKVMVGLLATIAGSALIFAFSILAATDKL